MTLMLVVVLAQHDHFVFHCHGQGSSTVYIISYFYFDGEKVSTVLCGCTRRYNNVTQVILGLIDLLMSVYYIKASSAL